MHQIFFLLLFFFKHVARYIPMSERTAVLIVFMVGAALFVQGNGIHTTAVMFKHPIKDFIVQYPDVATAYPDLGIIYSYIRDVWEHIISKFSVFSFFSPSLFLLVFHYRLFFLSSLS